jgi:hypothetical protein
LGESRIEGKRFAGEMGILVRKAVPVHRERPGKNAARQQQCGNGCHPCQQAVGNSRQDKEKEREHTHGGAAVTYHSRGGEDAFEEAETQPHGEQDEAESGYLEVCGRQSRRDDMEQEHGEGGRATHDGSEEKRVRYGIGPRRLCRSPCSDQARSIRSLGAVRSVRPC